MANKITMKHDRLFGANGSSIDTFGTIKINMIIEERDIVWNFLICRKLTHSIILGMDLMTTHFDNIKFGSDRLYLSNINLNKHNIISQYKDLFNFTGRDYGITGIQSEKCIILKEDFVYFVQPYRYNDVLQRIIEQKIVELKEHNIIEPVDSNIASPIVMVKKKDGSYRMCINYKKLNTITERINYIFPRIDELPRRLKGKTVFTKLDLKDGYHQFS